MLLEDGRGHGELGAPVVGASRMFFNTGMPATIIVTPRYAVNITSHRDALGFAQAAMESVAPARG